MRNEYGDIDRDYVVSDTLVLYGQITQDAIVERSGRLILLRELAIICTFEIAAALKFLAWSWRNYQ